MIFAVFVGVLVRLPAAPTVESDFVRVDVPLYDRAAHDRSFVEIEVTDRDLKDHLATPLFTVPDGWVSDPYRPTSAAVKGGVEV
jgi:hypothetical protein